MHRRGGRFDVEGVFVEQVVRSIVVLAVCVQLRVVIQGLLQCQRAVTHPSLAPPNALGKPGGHVFRFQPRPFQRVHDGQPPQLLEQRRWQRRQVPGCGRAAQAVRDPRDQSGQRSPLGAALRIGQHGHGDGPCQCADRGRQPRHGGQWRKEDEATKVARHQPAGWARTGRHRRRVVRAPQWALWESTPWGCPTARTWQGSKCLAPGRGNSMLAIK